MPTDDYFAHTEPLSTISAAEDCSWLDGMDLSTNDLPSGCISSGEQNCLSNPFLTNYELDKGFSMISGLTLSKFGSREAERSNHFQPHPELDDAVNEGIFHRFITLENATNTAEPLLNESPKVTTTSSDKTAKGLVLEKNDYLKSPGFSASSPTFKPDGQHTSQTNPRRGRPRTSSTTSAVSIALCKQGSSD
jgi:hypothetical protein